MYIPAFYRIDDASESLAIAAERGFGVVVATGIDGPEAAHVPFVVDTSAGAAPRLRFHLARGNGLIAHARSRGRLLVIVSGPDTYVSPDWYQSADQVPTWNYVAVHLAGPARILEPGELRQQVDDLSSFNEARLLPKRPWSSEKMTARRLEGMLRGIVGVEMIVETVQGKRKLSQNKSDADRAGVIAALRQRPDASGQAIAELMTATADLIPVI